MNNNTSRLRLALNFLSIALIAIVLLSPNRLSDIEWMVFLALPLELFVLGLCLLLPGRAGSVCRILGAIIFAVGIILKLADIAVFQVFARPFNPVLDAFFIANGMNLLSGALGYFRAILIAIVLVIVVLGIIALSFWLMRRAQQQLRSTPKISFPILLAGLAIWSMIWITQTPGAIKTFYEQLADHVSTTYLSYAELKHFRQELEVDEMLAKTPAGNLFNKLKGKDVLIVFIESYGRTVLDTPEFAQHVRPVLQQGTQDLAARGIGARSAFLTSSTLGGLSWLAHGTALSGLWINSQERYNSLVMSQRPSLNRLFRNAGWRTVAVMPAITMAWPEGDYFGYQHIYNANNLGYKGEPFNWVTMPDQYVLSAYPYSMCFFCGGAGPESVMGLKLKKNRKFKTDEIHLFKGTLELNANDIYELNYILADAEVVD